MDKDRITGVVLAGGQGQRMGGVDKGHVDFDGSPMVKAVIHRLAPQVNDIVISANRNLERYQSYGFSVFEDSASSDNDKEQFQGPIAGILACLANVKTEYAVIVPCDAPLMSEDLVAKLTNSIEGEHPKLTLFEVEGRLQPLFGLYHTSLISDLSAYFESGQRKLVKWCLSQSPRVIPYDGSADTFSNINTLEELKSLQNRQ